MRNRYVVGSVIAAVVGGAIAARADYSIPVPQTGPVALVSAMVCTILGTPKQCPVHVNIGSDGSEKGIPSNPLSVSQGQRSNLGYCQLSNPATAVALSACSGTYGSGIPAGATAALIDFQFANVRETGDGTTTPTATLGMRHAPGSGPILFSTTLSALLFIQETPTAVLDITFLK